MATTTVMRLKSAELPVISVGFSYKGIHRYLITLPYHDAGQAEVREEVVLGVLNTLHAACQEHHFDVFAYCFLPDRLVMLARGKADASDMKAFLSAFRRSSSAALEASLGHSLWKKKYLERVLRRDEDTRDVALEVLAMPVRAGLVRRPEEYRFQGSLVVDVSRLLRPMTKKRRPPFRQPGSLRPRHRQSGR